MSTEMTRSSVSMRAAVSAKSLTSCIQSTTCGYFSWGNAFEMSSAFCRLIQCAPGHASNGAIVSRLILRRRSSGMAKCPPAQTTPMRGKVPGNKVATFDDHFRDRRRSACKYGKLAGMLSTRVPKAMGIDRSGQYQSHRSALNGLSSSSVRFGHREQNESVSNRRSGFGHMNPTAVKCPRAISRYLQNCSVSPKPCSAKTSRRFSPGGSACPSHRRIEIAGGLIPEGESPSRMVAHRCSKCGHASP